jgi:hypothetical protein
MVMSFIRIRYETNETVEEAFPDLAQLKETPRFLCCV